MFGLVRGGPLGGWLAKWIGDQHAKYLQDQLDHGGILLWVNVAGEDKEEKAVRVSKDHAAGDVHVHALPFHA